MKNRAAQKRGVPTLPIHSSISTNRNVAFPSGACPFALSHCGGYRKRGAPEYGAISPTVNSERKNENQLVLHRIETGHAYIKEIDNRVDGLEKTDKSLTSLFFSNPKH